MSATNDGPTPLGSVTTLTASVTAGSTVAYTWSLGDEQVGSGQIITHVYAYTGTYTAVVTASNSVSMITATTPITITAWHYIYLPLIVK